MTKKEFLNITDKLWDKYATQDYNSNMSIMDSDYDHIIDELFEKLNQLKQ